MDDRAELIDLIKKLFASQSLAVLSTIEDSSPYSNLVVFIAAADLKWVVFVTNRYTRKFKNIMSNPRVALLVDDRVKQGYDTQKTAVVTILGEAREVGDFEKIRLEEEYLEIHPNLREFVTSPDSVFIKVNVEKYILVQKFQEVVEVDTRNISD